jgi:hypothetical protein
LLDADGNGIRGMPARSAGHSPRLTLILTGGRWIPVVPDFQMLVCFVFRVKGVFAIEQIAFEG